MRRDRTFDYTVKSDCDAARAQSPHPDVMNVGTGRFHDALETWRRNAGLVTPHKSF